uniref:Uncharacterized protein n=1 Tax=Anguilla anguilla TaxID=7936 RepID=A0A0E9PM36_ANGAN
MTFKFVFFCYNYLMCGVCLI